MANTPRKKTPKVIAGQLGRKLIDLNKLLGEAMDAGMTVMLAPNDLDHRKGLSIIHMDVKNDLMEGVDESVKGDGTQVLFGANDGTLPTTGEAGAFDGSKPEAGGNRFLKGTALETPQEENVKQPDVGNAAAAAAAATAGGQAQQTGGPDMDFRSTAAKEADAAQSGKGNQPWDVQRTAGGIDPSAAHTPGQGQFDLGNADDEGNIPT